MRRIVVLMVMVALVAGFAIPAGAEEATGQPKAVMSATAVQGLFAQALDPVSRDCSEVPIGTDEWAEGIAMPVVVCAVDDTGNASAALRAEIARAAAAGKKAIEYPFGLSGGSRVVIKYEPTKGSPGEIQPQWTVGAGWNIYVYLNGSDYNFLLDLGTAAASAALCLWLTPTLGGAIACAVAVTIVSNYVFSQYQPPSGYCREFKFYYWGTFRSTKLVQRSC